MKFKMLMQSHQKLVFIIKLIILVIPYGGGLLFFAMLLSLKTEIKKSSKFLSQGFLSVLIIQLFWGIGYGIMMLIESLMQISIKSDFITTFAVGFASILFELTYLKFLIHKNALREETSVNDNETIIDNGFNNGTHNETSSSMIVTPIPSPKERASRRTPYKEQRKRNKYHVKPVYLVRLGCGMMLFVGVLFLILRLAQTGNSVLMPARIAKIENEQVSVEYEFEGESYLNKLNYYSSDFQVGDEWDIYINRNHPHSFFSRRDIDFLVDANLIFLLIIVISFFPFDNVKKKWKQ